MATHPKTVIYIVLFVMVLGVLLFAFPFRDYLALKDHGQKITATVVSNDQRNPNLILYRFQLGNHTYLAWNTYPEPVTQGATIQVLYLPESPDRTCASSPTAQISVLAAGAVIGAAAIAGILWLAVYPLYRLSEHD